MTVDILCKVVDNLGDIGFVYRLARALSELSDAPCLRLIVDDLAAFAGICPGVCPDTGLQTVAGWIVARWDDPGEDAVRLFLAERPRMVLECYACGRPPWFESILFDESDPVPRHIVNLEYLTAESWACDFHKLPSLTRSTLVRKTIFMPGFQSGTGGLLQDAAFCALVSDCSSREGRLAVRRALLERGEVSRSSMTGLPDIRGLRDERGMPEEAFWFLVFSYEHDFSSIVSDLARFHADRPVLAIVASGRSSGPFLAAWKCAGCPFPVLVLPLLSQTCWDGFIVSSDFAVVRGEESLSRACLCGHPFLWQCYPFGSTDDEADSETDSLFESQNADRGQNAGSGQPARQLIGQLPKVSAFLELIEPFLTPGEFVLYERLTLRFNGVEAPADGEPAESRLSPGYKVPDSFIQVEPAPGDLLAVLRALDGAPDGSDGLFASGSSRNSSGGPITSGKRTLGTGFTAGFGAWSQEVRDIGNLAVNLLTYMCDLG